MAQQMTWGYGVLDPVGVLHLLQELVLAPFDYEVFGSFFVTYPGPLIQVVYQIHSEYHPYVYLGTYSLYVSNYYRRTQHGW